MSSMIDITPDSALFLRQLQPLGQALRAERKKAGLTQQAMASLTGIPRQAISAMETGRFTGSIAKVATYADALRYRLRIEPARYPTMEEIDALFNSGGDDD